MKHSEYLQKINEEFPSPEVVKQKVQSELRSREEKLVKREKLKDYRGEAAVLMTLATNPLKDEFVFSEDVYLILEKRSSKMTHNPGDMAFPGGSVDEQDDSPMSTAYREAEEEIGLKPVDLQFLAYMDEYVSSSQKVVRLVVAWLDEKYNGTDFREYLERKYKPQNGETEETVVIPIGHFLDPTIYNSVPYNLESNNPSRRRGFIRYFEISKYLPDNAVWGLTATMIRRFIDLFFDRHLLPLEISNVPEQID